MNIIDNIKFKNMTPIQAEGKFCIDLTDPLTNKIKERFADKNTIFTESFLGGAKNDILTDMSSMCVVLTDSTAIVDPKFPFVLGNPKAYGIPSYSGEGLYRGAYNVANQILEQRSLTSVKWKFQYDFTTAQANDTFGTIGITNQHRGRMLKYPISRYRPQISTLYSISGTGDGRYKYICSDLGIITKDDIWIGTKTDIDVSAITGMVGRKHVGYNPITKKYYIYVYSSTPSLRMFYQFSDSSFSTLEASYLVSNIDRNVTYSAGLYIYGTEMFFNGGDEHVYYADFITNSALTTVTFNPATNILTTTSEYANTDCGASVGYDKYIITSFFYANSTNDYQRYYSSWIFDMESHSFVSPLHNIQTTYRQALGLYPFFDSCVPCFFGNNAIVGYNNAVSAKKLSTPITKTSSYGMTVTYEVEVFY